MITGNINGIRIEGKDEYFNPDLISVKERSRIYYAPLTENDFCTGAPNEYNICKTANGIYTYLKLKRQHIKDYI